MALIGCVLPKQQQAAPFTLLEAGMQEQRSGVHGGGSSQDFTFKVLVTTDDKIVFDSVWVEGQMLGLRIEKEGHLLGKNERIAKNDILILHASSFIPSEPGSSTLPEPVKSEPPVKFTGKALIRYYHADKPGHFTVTAIRELPPVIMH
ncbi:hypothetical protein [Botryobacter ruber]|uniref:hypothetical protein n=1 Tax=Botryobacter ruber TaxID=2171629 RepID=UPI000E0A8906|nr:hypothetical protein [Botryobacter ruber]